MTTACCCPGSWADREAPYLVNPSYVSPAATQALRRASGDARWGQLESGSRKVIGRLSTAERLPPDWAEVEADGSAHPVAAPSGEPEVFGYDAARVVPRHAESADADDRANAAGTRGRLWEHHPARALYDLAGSPRSEIASPLAYAARAASSAADDHLDEAAVAMGAADALSRAHPSYYGDAWTALGWMLVTRGSLDGTSGEAS